MSKKKRGPGRPAMGKAGKRWLLRVRLGDQDRDTLKTEAQRLEVSRSEAVRIGIRDLPKRKAKS